MPKISPTILWRRLRHKVYPRPEEDSGTRLMVQIGVEGFFGAIVLNLATVFTAMFATRMGASARQIGLLGSMPQLVGLLMLIPGTLLTGKLSTSRLPVEASLLGAGIIYGLAGLSPMLGEWRVPFLILMISLAGIPMSLYNSSWQNYFTDVVPIRRRNAVYSLRSSMTFVAAIISVLVTGLALNVTTDDQKRLQLYMICYLLCFGISILQWLVLRQSPRHINDTRETQLRNLTRGLRILLQNKSFCWFAGCSFVMHAGWYFANQLFFLSQVRYFGANELWNAGFTVISTLGQWLSIPFWSKFIHVKGQRLTLAIGSFGMAANTLGLFLIFFLPFGMRLPAKLLWNLISGLFIAPFMLTIVNTMLEFLPDKFRQISIALYTMVIMLINTVMQMCGVMLYSLLGETQEAMMLSVGVAILLRIVGSLLMLHRWYLLRNTPDAGMI